MRRRQGALVAKVEGNLATGDQPLAPWIQGRIRPQM